MKIINATRHPATPYQIAVGVVEPDAAQKAAMVDALTFHVPPPPAVIRGRAQEFAEIVAASAKEAGVTTAMIGGTPFFMAAAASAIQAEGITPVYAFSTRDVVEEVTENGTVTKKTVFRHAGFVPHVHVHVIEPA